MRPRSPPDTTQETPVDPQHAPLTLAVTGAAGAVGSAVVEQALRAGHRVIAIARSPEGVPQGATLRCGDLTQRAFCQQAVQGAEIVIHTAALSDPSLPIEDLVPINVDAVRWLYEAAQEAGARRFIHLSSAALYKPRRGVLNEDAEFESRSNYSVTKEEAERFLRSRPLDALPWTILRPSLTYGPRARNLGATALLLPPLLRLFFRYVPTVSGGPRNNWVHTEDVARAALFVADHPRAAREIFNVADDTPLSQGEILSAAIQAYGLDLGPSVPFPTGLLPSMTRFLNASLLFRILTNLINPLWKRIEQRHNLVGNLHLNIDRSVMTYLGGDRVIAADKLKALGWTPRWPDLRRGMAQTIQSYQDLRWLPDYRAVHQDDVDYSDLGIALAWRERYEGVLDNGHDDPAFGSLELDLTFPNVKQLLVERTALIEGHISLDGIAAQAPVQGTLKVHIASGRMEIQFAFDGDDGRGYRFSGPKKFGIVSLITDFAHLEGLLIDSEGHTLGQARWAMDLKEGIARTAQSVRLG